MTQAETSHNTVAPLRNVAALAALIRRIQDRDIGLPGMGTFYGPSGYGKSFAALYATNKFQAVTVEVKSRWTAKKLCEAILTELAQRPAKTIGDMIDQINHQLAITDRPLLIDEADTLVKRNMIEIARDIYEGSQAPVILIGEELLPQNLKQWERVHGRMLDWVAAEPADLGDVGHMANIYCPDVSLTEDLQLALMDASANSLRRIGVNLARLREFAKLKGRKTLSTADYNVADFFSGEPPSPRQFANPHLRSVS